MKLGHFLTLYTKISSKWIKSAVKTLVKDVGTYLNINTETKDTKLNTYTVDTFINKDSEIVSEELEKIGLDVVLIGEGDKIINQYPKSGTIMNLNNKMFLLTNDNKYKMPDIKGWSRNEITTFANMINLDINFSGNGYAKEYNIEKGTEITNNMTLEVVLESNFDIKK